MSYCFLDRPIDKPVDRLAMRFCMRLYDLLVSFAYPKLYLVIVGSVILCYRFSLRVTLNRHIVTSTHNIILYALY